MNTISQHELASLPKEFHSLMMMENLESKLRSNLNPHWRRLVQSKLNVQVTTLPEPLNEHDRQRYSNEVAWLAWRSQIKPVQAFITFAPVPDFAEAMQSAMMLVDQLLRAMTNAIAVDGRCNAYVYERDGATVLELSTHFIDGVAK